MNAAGEVAVIAINAGEEVPFFAMNAAREPAVVAMNAGGEVAVFATIAAGVGSRGRGRGGPLRAGCGGSDG